MNQQPEIKPFPVNTRLFNSVYKADDRVIVHQGGARSGKTWSILQAHVAELLEPSNKDAGLVLSIVRKSGVSLRQSAQRDFFSIIKAPSYLNPHGLDIYDVNLHKRTSPEEYRLNGNLVEFMGIDNADKKRGTSRDYLFVNEANDLIWDDFNQLAMRTRGRIVIDYNPSEEYHWIYDRVLTRDDCKFVHSTYKDNKFLSQATIDEIEGLEAIDPAAWKVFGLGERSQIRGKIYSNWQSAGEFKTDRPAVYGLDFGYNNPSALIKCGMHDKELYLEEELFLSGLTNSDLISRMKTLNIKGRIYCDNAEPARIEELRRAGFDAHPANKSVKDGIDFIQRHKINVINSPNIEKEIKNYKWREDKAGNVFDEPVKYNDHAMDAIRYGAFTAWYIPPAQMQRQELEPMLDSDFSQGW